jgi:hypothetical protein
MKEKEMGRSNPKTECVLFPPPKYFDKMEATATLENGTETHTITTIANKQSKESGIIAISISEHTTRL